MSIGTAFAYAHDKHSGPTAISIPPVQCGTKKYQSKFNPGGVQSACKYVIKLMQRALINSGPCICNHYTNDTMKLFLSIVFYKSSFDDLLLLLSTNKNFIWA